MYVRVFACARSYSSTSLFSHIENSNSYFFDIEQKSIIYKHNLTSRYQEYLLEIEFAASSILFLERTDTHFCQIELDLE
jgi:hypothetical protein